MRVCNGFWGGRGGAFPLLPVVQGGVSLSATKSTEFSAAVCAALPPRLQWVLRFLCLLTALPPGGGGRLTRMMMVMMIYLTAETAMRTLPNFHTLNSRVRTASPAPLAKALAAFPQVSAPLLLSLAQKKRGAATLLPYLKGFAIAWSCSLCSFCFAEQVNELVALIPYSDQRLRPQRT